MIHYNSYLRISKLYELSIDTREQGVLEATHYTDMIWLSEWCMCVHVLCNMVKEHILVARVCVSLV